MRLSIVIILFLAISFSNCQVAFLQKQIKSIQCKACHEMVRIIQEGESNMDEDINIFLTEVALAVCYFKKIQTYSVCEGAISEMIPSILESVVQRYLDAEEICPLVKLCPQVYERLSENDYIKEVIADKPANSQWPEVKEGGKKIKMIHMSDLHFDFLYLEGSKATCNYPLCCREQSGKVKQGEPVAGYWGTLADCNIPQRTLEQMFSFMKENIYVEGEKLILLWTGDNTSHDVWEQSREKNSRNTKVATELLKKTFPNNDVIIIPQVGNHEAYPVNVFDFKTDREQGFRKEIAELWKDWIGEEQAITFQNKGFYKIEIKEWNFKVLTFDSQICNSQNWFLIKDPTDPAGFLEWARQELIESEKKGQAVYITAHMFTSSCLEPWGVRFKALVDRFSGIIRGQIYGHSHGEYLQLYRGYSKNETLNVAFISSSVTTYSNKNPSFRVFEVDQETMIPTNYYQYRLDLNKANLNTKASLVWDVAFNFIEEYGSKSMTPQDIDDVLERQLTDITLTKKFIKNNNSGNWVETNEVNPRGMYCSQKSSLNSEESICNSGTVNVEMEDKIVNKLLGRWRKRID